MPFDFINSKSLQDGYHALARDVENVEFEHCSYIMLVYGTFTK